MAKINLNNMNSIVGEDAVVNGSIEMQEGLIVYGTVHGDIKAKGAIRVARTGKVFGSITGKDIHIGGKVQGDVHVEERTVLGENSVLTGDLTYKTLIIEAGAQFQGQCIILREDEEQISAASDPEQIEKDNSYYNE